MFSLIHALTSHRAFALALALFVTLPAALRANPTRITLDDAAEFARFGEAVAASDTTVAVASAATATRDAAIYVFVRSSSGWVQQAKITEPGVDSLTPLAIDVNTIVAKNRIYTRTGSIWTLDTVLPISPVSIAIAGNVIALGDPIDSTAGLEAGAVWIYTKGPSAWTGIQITASDASPGAEFGFAVALTRPGHAQNLLAVGAPGDSSARGAAHLFHRKADGTWIHLAKLSANDGAADDRFGAAVGIRQTPVTNGGTVVVGAPSYFEPGVPRGWAYVFGVDAFLEGSEWRWTWRQTEKITPHYGSPGSQFGSSISGNETMVIGSAPTPGTAYVYLSFAGHVFNYYSHFEAGSAGVAATYNNGGYYAITGIPTEDAAAGPDAGAAYVHAIGSPLGHSYTLWPRDIGQVSAAGSNDGASVIRGSGADVWGTADECFYLHDHWSGDGDFVIRVKDLTNTDPNAKVGLMFRETLHAGSRNIFAFIRPEFGTGLQRREWADGQSEFQPGSYGPPPKWLKLRRHAGTFSAYQSSDGHNWLFIASYPDNLPRQGFVGLAITSHHDGVLATANLEEYSIGRVVLVPPAAPSNLRAEASGSNIFLTWTDNSSDESLFIIERSTDGENFTHLGSTWPNETSYVDMSLSPNTTYFYRVRAMRGTFSYRGGRTYSAYSQRASATTPGDTSAWQTRDIGGVAASGSASQSDGIFTVTGSGEDFWGNADEGHFMYRSAGSDWQITARILSIDHTHGWAKAGVMLRDSLATGSRNVFMMVGAGNNFGMQYRPHADAGTHLHLTGTYAWFPVWVKLVRRGNAFSSYYSSDGTNWNAVTTVTMDLNSTALVGLAVTAHSDGALCTARFDNVAMGAPDAETSPAAPTNFVATPTSPNRIQLSWTDNATNETEYVLERSTNNFDYSVHTTPPANTNTYADEGLAPGTTYYYRIHARNSAGVSGDLEASATTPPATSWSESDIGSIGVPGSSNIFNDRVLVDGSGDDIWGARDSFHYLYRGWTGDGEIFLRVVDVSHTHAWAKAGVMFRESLASFSPNAFVYLTPLRSFGFQTRVAAGVETNYTPGPQWASLDQYWVRLVRSGDMFTASYSADGDNWISIGSQTVPMGPTIYIGIAVTSHDNTVLTRAEFTGLTVLP